MIVVCIHNYTHILYAHQVQQAIADALMSNVKGVNCSIQNQLFWLMTSTDLSVNTSYPSDSKESFPIEHNYTEGSYLFNLLFSGSTCVHMAAVNSDLTTMCIVLNHCFHCCF